MNDELRRIFEESNGYDPSVERKLAEIQGKIDNIHRAIEDGYPDMAWSVEPMRELLAEKERLSLSVRPKTEAPQIDFETAVAYSRNMKKVLTNGDTAAKKGALRTWVKEIKLTPETLAVEINYRIPESVVNRLGAGAWSIANYNPPVSLFCLSVELSRNVDEESTEYGAIDDGANLVRTGGYRYSAIIVFSGHPARCHS